MVENSVVRRAASWADCLVVCLAAMMVALKAALTAASWAVPKGDWSADRWAAQMVVCSDVMWADSLVAWMAKSSAETRVDQ